MPSAEDQPATVAGWPRRLGGVLWRLVVTTVGSCMRHRVTGLAAEAAFFAILSIPPLVFALAGAIGFVTDQFSQAQIADFRQAVIDLSSRGLTDKAVDTIIVPTLNTVLGQPALRRDLARLRARPLVGLARAQRLRRHHHDHARPGRAPRDRQDADRCPSGSTCSP